MKNLILITAIIIILFKTGNVLSDNNIFSVNNIEINKENSKDNEKLVNEAFQKAFKALINRILLEEDQKKVSATNSQEVKKLISYYQIIENNQNTKKIDSILVNVFFDKDRIHDFFYKNNILYSDSVDTEVLLFPMLINDNQYFVYTKNYFYENWKKEDSNDLIQYTLPVENIENIEIIEKNKNNIYKLNIDNFFKEYKIDNLVFAAIDIKDDRAKIFLNTKTAGKKLNKNLLVVNTNLSQKKFKDLIIYEIKKEIRNLVKSQNLIDVRTPSFLNVEIKLNNKSNLIKFNNRIKKIDLVESFYVQKLNKNYVSVKIKYLGKINKIISKFKDQNIDLQLIDGSWQINIIS